MKICMLNSLFVLYSKQHIVFSLSLSDPLTLSLFLSTLKRIYFRVTSTFLSLLFPLLSLTWSQGTPIVTQYN